MASMTGSTSTIDGPGDVPLQALIALNKEAYWNAIDAHAARTTLQSLFPGHGYDMLRTFLARAPLRPRPANLQTHRFPDTATLYTIDNEVKPDVRSYNELGELVNHLANNVERSKNQIVFVKGYPSPEWLVGIGALFQTDPEIFRLHLEFGDRKEHDASPSLPSSLDHIIRLRLCTVGSREDKTGASDQTKVDRLRNEASEAKRLYAHDLERARSCKRGDSVVRDYHVLDEKHFLIEQDISVCLSQAGGSWSVLILTDIGNDLSQGALGPWLSTHDQESAVPWTRFYPVVQHKHRIALLPKAPYPTDPSSAPTKFPQSASLLAEHYAEYVDMELLSRDPFYALNELFQFIASAENLFLATLKMKISSETGYNSANHQQSTLSNLMYFQNILRAHETRMLENIDVIKKRGHRTWPRVSDPGVDAKTHSEQAAESLLKDFEHLNQICQKLQDRCSQGTNIILNAAMLSESKEAKKQAEGLKKLTFVAFFYIPLSFTTSFFGMNFKQLGEGTLSVWIFFVAAIPLLIVSNLFLLWDYYSFYVSGKELVRRITSFFY